MLESQENFSTSFIIFKVQKHIDNNCPEEGGGREKHQ